MTESLKLWWRTRTLREQQLLLAAGALALIVFAWLLVIRPLGDALSEARERHAEAATALAETKAAAALITGMENRAPVELGASVDMIVANAAAEAGFPVSRIDREGIAQATLAIEAVRPQAFFAWVDRMETERGLVVERLSATGNGDQTLSVEVTFRARAG